MQKRFFIYFLVVLISILELGLLQQVRGRQGQSLSVHHWTEISISMPKIEIETRTLNVLLEITSDIVSLLPVGGS